MQLLTFSDNEQLSRWIVRRLVKALENKPDLIVCPASGNSPLRAYQLLGEEAEIRPALFRHIRIVQLDEFIAQNNAGKGVGDAYMRKYLLDPLGVDSSRYLGFDVRREPEEEARRMHQRLSSWGNIDVCILGVGLNGHLGLLEPAAELPLHTHVATLAPTSREHHMLREVSEKPRKGITLGIGDLLHAREVLLPVNGTHKQKVLATLQEKRISTQFPASLLWLHPGAVCAADQDAMGKGGR